MLQDLAATPGAVLSFLVVLTRFAGMVTFLPFLGSRTIPAPVRVVVAVSLSLLLFPVLQPSVRLAGVGEVELLLRLGFELVIGFLLGLGGSILLSTLQMAGQLMGFQIGFSVVNAIDPQTQVETPVLATLQGIFGITLLVTINAHHWFIEAIVRSFHTLSVDQLQLSPSLLELVLQMSAEIFSVGLQMAAPVVAVLITVDIVLGIVGRAAPQVHVLIVGMPLKVIVGVAIFGQILPAYSKAVSRYLSSFEGYLHNLITLLN